MQLTESVNEQCVCVSKIHAQVRQIRVTNVWIGNFCFLDVQLASLLCSRHERGRSSLRAGSFAVYEPNLSIKEKKFSSCNLQTSKL